MKILRLPSFLFFFSSGHATDLQPVYGWQDMFIYIEIGTILITRGRDD